MAGSHLQKGRVSGVGLLSNAHNFLWLYLVKWGKNGTKSTNLIITEQVLKGNQRFLDMFDEVMLPFNDLKKFWLLTFSFGKISLSTMSRFYPLFGVKTGHPLGKKRDISKTALKIKEY